MYNLSSHFKKTVGGCMKKFFTFLLTGVLFLCVFGLEKGFSEDINTAMDKAVLSAWGETLTKIVEEKTNVPASSAAKVAGYISGGDYKSGLYEFFKLANDVVYSQLPVIGTAKFVVELEATLINVWKQYLDWYLISSKWSYFKTLSDSEKEQWLNGYMDIPKLEFGGGAGYLVNNKYDIRTLFGKYWDNAKKSEAYMEGIKQVGEIFERAKYLSEPILSSPKESSTVDVNEYLYFYPWGNNFLRFTVTLPDGKTSSVVKKITIEEADVKDVRLQLSEFAGINWDSYKASSDTKVQIKVQATIWDSSGLVEAVMGSSYVSPKEKILMNVPDQDKSYVEDTFYFNLKSEEPATEEFYMILNLHFSYKMSYNVSGYQSGSQNVTGTVKLTYKVNCGNKTAVDNSGLNWSAECNGDKVKLWLSSGGVTIYLNNTVNGTSVSGNISSNGSLKQSQNADGYSVNISISDFSGYITGNTNK